MERVGQNSSFEKGKGILVNNFNVSCPFTILYLESLDFTTETFNLRKKKTVQKTENVSLCHY